MTPSSRKRIYQLIVEDADWQVGQIDHETIDEINILQATCEAMRMALISFVKLKLLLIDVVKLKESTSRFGRLSGATPCRFPSLRPPILAKVTRDQIMEEYDLIYPEYGFAQHKGYGTARHCEALKKYGPCPIHRKTFIRSILGTD